MKNIVNMNSVNNRLHAPRQDDSDSINRISSWEQSSLMSFVCVLATAYAIARYNYFGDVSTNNVPLYIFNKSISLSSVVFLLLSSWKYAQGNSNLAKFWGTSSLHFAMLHIAMSIVLLSESYYPKFYGVGMMNLNGEASVLFGLLAGYCYFLLGTRARQHMFLILKVLAAFAICLHLFIMGYSNWFSISNWPGRLPPISLISFLVGIAALFIYLRVLYCSRRNRA